MNVNIRSLFYLTHRLTPYLILSKGCVVNVSSVNGIRSVFFIHLYYHIRIIILFPLTFFFAKSVVYCNFAHYMFKFPGVLAYNISKAAVDQFTRCVSLELASKGVRVNSVK